MAVEEVLVYLKALSAALGYAHAFGVVHCDVKPGNVMVDQGGNIYLTDFGIARHSDSTTTTLATVGTAAYMAPEQIRGEAVSPATDVYALGVMLFEMLTGQRPFKGDEKGTESGGATANERIRYAHLALQPPDPRIYNPDLHEDVALIILKALHKDSIQRYQKVNELYQVLCNSAGVTIQHVQDRIQGEKANVDSEITNRDTRSQIKSKKPVSIYLIAPIFLIIIIITGMVFIQNRILNPSSSENTRPQTSPALFASPIKTANISIIGQTTTAVVNLPTPTTSPTTTTIISNPTQFNKTITVGDGSILVNVPEGEFLMGLTADQLNAILRICPNCNPAELVDTSPQRKIYLDSYWISQNEITNQQFARFVAATGYQTTAENKGGGYVYSPIIDEKPPYINGADWQHPFGPTSNIIGREQNPVVQVSWDDASAYCIWAGMRLPTEAEWEKAARGEQGQLFTWGNSPPNSNLLNYNHENHGPINVASYSASLSPYGLYDMAGNVWEWVSDFYLDTYYQQMPDRNPTGPTSGEGHPFRGGSWASDYDGNLILVTTVYRLWNYSNNRSNVIGFRCAMDGMNSTAPQFGEIQFCVDQNCLNGPQSVFPQGIKEVYFSYSYQNLKPGTSYGRRWYVNGNLYLDYNCKWGSGWTSEGVFLKKVYDYDYSLAPGEWRLETYIDGQLQATAMFTVQGPTRYEDYLAGYQCNDTSPTMP